MGGRRGRDDGEKPIGGRVGKGCRAGRRHSAGTGGCEYRNSQKFGVRIQPANTGERASGIRTAEVRRRENRKKGEGGERTEGKRGRTEEKEERERREREEERRRREEKEERERKEREGKEEREFELRTQQLELERQRLNKSADSKILADEARSLRRSLASRIKFLNDALKGTVGKLPTDSAQIPIYLNHLEKVFETIGVDEDCKASILLT